MSTLKTCIVVVKDSGLLFPFNLPASVVAYRADTSGDESRGDVVLTILLRELSPKEAKLPKQRIRELLEREGFTLSRMGVLHEDLAALATERQLKPILLQLGKSGWTVASEETALIEAVCKASTRAGSADILDLLNAITQAAKA